MAKLLNLQYKNTRGKTYNKLISQHITVNKIMLHDSCNIIVSQLYETSVNGLNYIKSCNDFMTRKRQTTRKGGTQSHWPKSFRDMAAGLPG